MQLKARRWIFILSFVYSLLIALALIGIRFDIAILNYIFGTLIFSSPLFLLFVLIFKVIAIDRYKKIIQCFGIFVAGILSLIAAILILFNFFDIISLASGWQGQDQSKLEIQRVHVDLNVDVVAYQTNGGATTDFGISIYKERRLIPGLKQVRYMDGAYHMHDIVLAPNNTDSVIVKETRFGSPDFYEQEYYGQGGKLKSGYTLMIK